MVPHTYWLRAGILRKSCGLSYIELYTAADAGMLERRVVGKRVYYKNKQAPMFEPSADEIIGVSE